MFNFCDILCLDRSRTIAVQAMGADINKHKQKLLENQFVIPWLQAGNELQFWAWRKLKVKRGGKAMRWDCKVIDILLVNNEISAEER